MSIIDDGKPKLVLFVAHWCPHCQREVPLLADYLKANPLPAGLELFTIATATDSAKPNFPPSAWLEGAGWPGSTIADDANGSAAAAFGLPGFPYFVAVDSHNKVIARTSGEIPVDQFSALVQKALTG